VQPKFGRLFRDYVRDDVIRVAIELRFVARLAAHHVRGNAAGVFAGMVVLALLATRIENRGNVLAEGLDDVFVAHFEAEEFRERGRRGGTQDLWIILLAVDRTHTTCAARRTTNGIPTEL